MSKTKPKSAVELQQEFAKVCAALGNEVRAKARAEENIDKLSRQAKDLEEAFQITARKEALEKNAAKGETPTQEAAPNEGETQAPGN